MKLITKALWIFMLIFAATSLRTWYIQERESRMLEEKRETYQASIHQLEEEIHQLRNTLENITGDEYIESVARHNLRMVKEDEWVLIDIQKGRE